MKQRPYWYRRAEQYPLRVYANPETETVIREASAAAGMPISKWLKSLALREIAQQEVPA